jgi:hypothetical protein
MEKMFEQATRLKLRFVSTRGELSVENLWDVPLRSRDDCNLDKIARGVNRDLEQASEESFVDTVKNNPAKNLLELKLKIVKHVITVKLEEEEQTKTRAENKIEREKLLAILAEKQDGKLSELSEKELKKRIEALTPQ